MIRAARGWARQARSQLDDQLGPEFRDLDLSALHPKTFVRKALLDDDDDPLGLGSDHTAGPDEYLDDEDHKDTSPPALAASERAPYDHDAT